MLKVTEFLKLKVWLHQLFRIEKIIQDFLSLWFIDRFREDTPEILKLREKEKGDWKKLTIAEKKVLYRASFCQTIAEVINQSLIINYLKFTWNLDLSINER